MYASTLHSKVFIGISRSFLQPRNPGHGKQAMKQDQGEQNDNLHGGVFVCSGTAPERRRGEPPRGKWHGAKDRQSCLLPKPAGDSSRCHWRKNQGMVFLRGTQGAQATFYDAIGGRCGGAMPAESDRVARRGMACGTRREPALDRAITSSWSGRSSLLSIKACSFTSEIAPGIPGSWCALWATTSGHCGTGAGTFRPAAEIPTHNRKWKIRTAVKRRNMVRNYKECPAAPSPRCHPLHTLALMFRTVCG